MARPITAKINVLKIDKKCLYKGAKGLYLDIAIWPNQNGQDEFGNTHYITQSVSKEAREKGIKGAIIGDLRMNGNGGQASPRPVQPPTRPANRAIDSDPDDTVPF